MQGNPMNTYCAACRMPLSPDAVLYAPNGAAVCAKCLGAAEVAETANRGTTAAWIASIAALLVSVATFPARPPDTYKYTILSFVLALVSIVMTRGYQATDPPVARQLKIARILGLVALPLGIIGTLVSVLVLEPPKQTGPVLNDTPPSQMR